MVLRTRVLSGGQLITTQYPRDPQSSLVIEIGSRRVKIYLTPVPAQHIIVLMLVSAGITMIATILIIIYSDDVYSYSVYYFHEAKPKEYVPRVAIYICIIAITT